jgi:DNA repair protein RecN (Recombination protein N)
VWKRVAELADVDPVFTPHLDARDAIKSQLEELAFALRSYGEGIDASPARLQEVEDRLALIERLKRKYGPSLDEVIATRAALARQLDALQNADERRAGLEAETKSAREQFVNRARELSERRREAANRFAKSLQELLGDLAMGKTRFEMRFDANPPETSWTENGIDVAECYLSANVGEDLRPLARIASGGELSRIMLALKSLALEDADAPTVIFDEVDAGIGGAVAEVVGRKLGALARRRQVLCITHLPQIAAFADHHFAVEKSTARGRTRSTARRLRAEERCDEIARMLGGVKVTAEAKRHAEQLLATARAGRKE